MRIQSLVRSVSLVAFAASLLAACLFACSSSSTPIATGETYNDAGKGNDTSTNTAVDGGNTNGDANTNIGDGGSQEDVTVSKSGSIYVYTNGPTMLLPHGSTGASITFDIESFGPSSCTTVDAGACSLLLCGADAGDGLLSDTAESAGAISISVNSGSPLIEQPQSDNTYAPPALSNTLWDGGETLTFSAAGATVPAFSATLTGPSDVTLTAPDLLANNVINRSHDLVLTWSGGTSGQISLLLYSTADGASVSCLFPLDAGTGTVPSSLLTQFAADPNASYIVDVAASTTTMAGDYSVSVTATRTLLQDGNLALGNAQLQ